MVMTIPIRRLLLHAPAALVVCTLTTSSTPVSAQFFGGFGSPGQEDKLVDRFDVDKDGRLNSSERAAARATRTGASSGSRRGGFGRGNMVSGSPGVPVAPEKVKTYPPSVKLYDPTALRTIFLTFENSDWEAELEDFNDTDVDVPAKAIVDGKTYADVGVHFRGASSYRSVPTGSKRSLNVTFDFANENQNLLGYRTLNLLNAMNDATFVRTVLYSQIARDYIVAPKVNFLRVVINGEDWGIYLNAQQFNKDMVREAYDDGNGARWHVPGSPRGRGGLAYLGDDVASYKELYEIKSKDSAKDWGKFIALTRTLDETPPDRLEAALAPILDIDETLKFLAIDVALANSDGYWTRASDYNIYLDEKNRFHVIPHDMNEALNGNAQLAPLVSITDPVKALRTKLLAVPALRARYLGYMRQVADKWLDWKRIGPLVDRYQALIEPEIEIDSRKLYSTASFRSDVQDLKYWFESRRTYLLNELP